LDLPGGQSLLQAQPALSAAHEELVGWIELAAVVHLEQLHCRVGSILLSLAVHIPCLHAADPPAISLSSGFYRIIRENHAH
jgi:hypothetical protein